jgi:alpha-D-xyloside xylohydrolase
MHNDYPVFYHRATRTIINGYERSHPGRKIFFFTRAGFSGTKGSAAYESANFPGDETTDWTLSSGLPSIVPDMLNRSVGGSWGYTTDIGGYFDYTSPPVTEELFTRWQQASALMPYFRVHNSSSTGVKMPWDFSGKALDRFRASSRLHAAALPYLRRLQQVAVRTGIPPTRPMWLAFPGQTSIADVSDQWMLGSDVLVAPVLKEGATTRTVALPRGCWTYVPTGKDLIGGRTVRVGADLSTLPYFFRCGTRPF